MLKRAILAVVMACGVAGVQAQAADAGEGAAVKAKLVRAAAAVDTPKLAVALYYQEQGAMPQESADEATVGERGHAPGTPTDRNSVWYQMGYSVFPSLPAEVSRMSLHSKTGVLTITLARIGRGIDRTTVTMRPEFGQRSYSWKASCTSHSPLVKAVFHC